MDGLLDCSINNQPGSYPDRRFDTHQIRRSDEQLAMKLRPLPTHSDRPIVSIAASASHGDSVGCQLITRTTIIEIELNSEQWTISVWRSVCCGWEIKRGQLAYTHQN